MAGESVAKPTVEDRAEDYRRGRRAEIAGRDRILHRESIDLHHQTEANPEEERVDARGKMARIRVHGRE